MGNIIKTAFRTRTKRGDGARVSARDRSRACPVVYIIINYHDSRRRVINTYIII
jgi:hypothetical protein